MAQVRSAKTFHLTARVSAPAKWKTLSGREEIDFEAPDKYRTLHRSTDGTTTRTIRIGSDLYVMSDGDDWRRAEMSVTESLSTTDIRAVLELACRVQPADTGFRVSLAPEGEACDDATTASMRAEGPNLYQIELSDATEDGVFAFSIKLDLARSVQPIVAPAVNPA